jgi:hypothetical protein
MSHALATSVSSWPSTCRSIQAMRCLPGCAADGGDDGRLQHQPHGRDCDAAYPTFLTYAANAGTALEKFSRDLACVGALGTQGCGFAQPLEASLKALWPSFFKDASGYLVSPNPISFLADQPQGTMGRGDLPAAQGGNLGFLRNVPDNGLSVIALVVVTDKEDCSIRDVNALRPKDQLDPSSPYYNQDIDLRCFYNKDALYDVASRYVKGLRALRQGHEDLFVFAAIAGVPADLVDGVARARVDFSNDAQRNAYYASVLSDSRMQAQIDPSSATGKLRLTPSCTKADAKGVPQAVAYPPRRLVEVARAMGEHGIIQSICQDDFGPALDPIIDVISKPLGTRCLQTALTRSSKGTVACDVIWELPPPGAAPTSTPTRCADLPFLKPVASPRKATNDRTGKNCVVTQLAGPGDVAAGDGWYYDTSSSELARVCRRTALPQRIAFSATAKPPTGVNVVLDCKASARAQ